MNVNLSSVVEFPMSIFWVGHHGLDGIHPRVNESYAYGRYADTHIGTRMIVWNVSLHFVVNKSSLHVQRLKAVRRKLKFERKPILTKHSILISTLVSWWNGKGWGICKCRNLHRFCVTFTDNENSFPPDEARWESWWVIQVENILLSCT